MKVSGLIGLFLVVAFLWLCPPPASALPEGAIVRLGKGRIGSGDRAVTFSPDGDVLAVATTVGVYLYDPVTHEEIVLIEMNEVMTSVAFSPDGSMLAGGSDDSAVKLWDVSSGEEIATLYGHSDSVSCKPSPFVFWKEIDKSIIFTDRS